MSIESLLCCGCVSIFFDCIFDNIKITAVMLPTPHLALFSDFFALIFQTAFLTLIQRPIVFLNDLYHVIAK